MAASEPTDDDISQVIEFVACDGETARRYLKVSLQDVHVGLGCGEFAIDRSLNGAIGQEQRCQRRSHGDSRW